MPPLNEGVHHGHAFALSGRGHRGGQADPAAARCGACAKIPEVQMVLGKIGRAETATDMAPMSMIETIAILKDKKDWRPGVTYDSIVSEANNTVTTPGVANMWSMPIKNRLDMLATGIKTPVGIKIFGPSLETLDAIGKQIEGILPAVRGTNTVFSERAVGGRYLDVTIDRDAAARFGMTTGDVQMALATAAGGMDVGQVIAGRERYAVLVRYPRELASDPRRSRMSLLRRRMVQQVALGQLARIEVTRGSTLIKSEDAYLNNIVYVDVRNRDVGGYVADARRVWISGSRCRLATGSSGLASMSRCSAPHSACV